MDVENPNGTIVPTTAPPAPRPIPGLDPAYLKVVQQGLFEGTHDSFGTSYGVFGNFPDADRRQDGDRRRRSCTSPGYTGEQDQSWWCGYGPANDPKLVVCAVIENGGEGGAAAAPAAERVFAKFFDVQPKQVRGTSTPTDARVRGITTGRAARRARGAAPARRRPLARLDPARGSRRRSSSWGSGASPASRSSRVPQRPELLPQPPDPLRVRGGGRARGGGARRSRISTGATGARSSSAPPW